VGGGTAAAAAGWEGAPAAGHLGVGTGGSCSPAGCTRCCCRQARSSSHSGHCTAPVEEPAAGPGKGTAPAAGTGLGPPPAGPPGHTVWARLAAGPGEGTAPGPPPAGWWGGTARGSSPAGLGGGTGPGLPLAAARAVHRGRGLAPAGPEQGSGTPGTGCWPLREGREEPPPRGAGGQLPGEGGGWHLQEAVGQRTQELELLGGAAAGKSPGGHTGKEERWGPGRGARTNEVKNRGHAGRGGGLHKRALRGRTFSNPFQS
jgi:hypothetical protein